MVILEHESHSPRQFFARIPAHGFSLQQHLTTTGLEAVSQNAQQGCLAGSIAPDEADQLPFLQLK